MPLPAGLFSATRLTAPEQAPATKTSTRNNRCKVSAVPYSYSTATLALGSAGSAAAADAPQVLLKTTMGDIVLELNQEKAPKTVANFLQYVKSGHYNGTIFHRVIDGFMIQGGGFDAR